MEKNKRLALTKAVVAVTAVLVFAAFAIVYFLTRPKAVEGSAELTLEFIYKSDTQTYTVQTEISDGTTVFDILKEFNEELDLKMKYDSYDFGASVTSFLGVDADWSGGEWYGFFINGDMASSGVSSTPAKDGETYSFKLINSIDDNNYALVDGANAPRNMPKPSDLKKIMLLILGGAALLLIVGYGVVSMNSKKKK